MHFPLLTRSLAKDLRDETIESDEFIESFTIVLDKVEKK